MMLGLLGWVLLAIVCGLVGEAAGTHTYTVPAEEQW